LVADGCARLIGSLIKVLDLRLSTVAGKARVSCDPAYTAQLQALRARFVSSSSTSNQIFDLELDDLLTNLNELTSWPSDDVDIRWDPDLLRLVEGNVSDAAVVQTELHFAGASAQFSTGVLGDDWTAELTTFQTRDVSKLLHLAHGANFSVPGAGKTRATLALFQARRESKRVSALMVVCPKSAYESWQYEARACFEGAPLRVAVFEGVLPPSADILLINYERLPDARPSLIQWLRRGPTMLVLDEAHRMKLGPAGAWGATCLALAPYAATRLILTGTPAPNGAKDLENLFAFVWPGQGRAAVVNALASNDLRAASVALRPLFVRTTKSELKLPPVDLSIRRIELPTLHRELYDALLGQLTTATRAGAQDLESLGKVLLYLLMAATTPALLAAGSSRYEPLPYRVPPIEAPAESSLADLMRDLPNYELSPKYQEVLAIVSDNAARNRKTLVWSTFVRNLKSLEVLLEQFNPAIVHGGTEDRADQLERFRRDPSCMVLLSNPATLGEGVSLHHECHDAVYIDRDFAAGRFLQSLDRIHRLGLPPETRTQITVLVANRTIDEVVEQRLASKLQFMGGVLDDPAVLQLGDLDEEPSVGGGLDSSDVAALLGHLQKHAAS
jgi:SNF2 family DNA or RNA helicase